MPTARPIASITKATLVKARFVEKIAGRAAMAGWASQHAPPEIVVAALAACVALHAVQQLIAVEDD